MTNRRDPAESAPLAREARSLASGARSPVRGADGIARVHLDAVGDLVIPRARHEALRWGLVASIPVATAVVLACQPAPSRQLESLRAFAIFTVLVIGAAFRSFLRQPFTVALRKEHLELPQLGGPVRRIPYGSIERVTTPVTYNIRGAPDVAIYLILRPAAVGWYRRAFAITRQLMIQGSRWDREAIADEIRRRVSAAAATPNRIDR